MSENYSSAGDADLLTRVGIALTLRMRHTLHAIHIVVDNGAVTLKGVVPTFYDRQLAIEVTRHIAGVLRVKDELSVVPNKSAANPSNPLRESSTSALRGAGTESARRSSAASLEQRAQSARRWTNLFSNAAVVLRSLFLLLAVALTTGCSDSAYDAAVAVHPTKGKITFKGQPIPGAMVTLHPKTAVTDVPKPRASVGKDGEFTFTTFSGKDGAPEGEYTVTVVWYKPIRKGADVQAGPNVIPKKYTAPQTSDLQVRIAAGQNELPAIQL